MSTVGLFSKRDWETQSERIPGLINIARIAILFSLLVIQIAGNYADSDGPLAIFPPAEFYSWAAVYGVLILVTVLKPEWQRQTLDLPNANAVADITMMMILTYMAGGIDSGFGILVLPFVATSCLLSHGRYPMLYASYAAMLIVLTMFLLGHISFMPFDVAHHSIRSSVCS